MKEFVYLFDREVFVNIKIFKKITPRIQRKIFDQSIGMLRYAYHIGNITDEEYNFLNKKLVKFLNYQRIR
ncbi:unnamed protein product [marine sediment metagenome]|uniref:Uncharacterized protein n=1 Tax=marine sediment metagenome TaxID=412755 RepID=X0S303_9ZZZZ